jgi:pimeloyl-ACP methyl ester carboxylesterase
MSDRKGNDKAVFLAVLLSALAVGAARGQSTSHRGPAGDPEALRYVQVNGVRLAYRVEGAGSPVVFVHGEGYSHELWTRQIDAFKEKHLFLSYDRRGHGQSEDPLTGYSPIAHAEDLHALLQHLGIREAHFVVNSRGGAVIMQFLRMYPDKVRSLVFADATIGLAEISPTFAPVVKQILGPPPSLEEALAAREGAKKSSFTKVAQSREDTRIILNRMVDQYSPRNRMNPQRSDMGSPMDIGPWTAYDFPDMAKMHQPILLIVGELTDIFFIEGAQKAHRLWPNTRYHMIPGTDHLLMLEAPQEFNRLVLEFLAEVDAKFDERRKAQRVNED